MGKNDRLLLASGQHLFWCWGTTVGIWTPGLSISKILATVQHKSLVISLYLMATPNKPDYVTKTISVGILLVKKSIYCGINKNIYIVITYYGVKRIYCVI